MLPPNTIYKFGVFRLDRSERVLFKDSEMVPLKPKAIEILLVLVEGAGKVVSKRDLMNAVWHDVFVEENNLSVNIYELRKAFAKFDEGTKYIETVSGRGFRFVQNVELVDQPVDTQTDEGPSVTDRPGPIAEPREREGASVARPDRYFRYLIAVAAVIVAGLLLVAAFKLFRPPGENSGKLRVHGTQNLEAEQFYLRGRQLWLTRDNSEMLKAVDFFRRAIAADPNYAEPYLGLADSYSMMTNDRSEWRQAEAFAEKALEIDPDLADAHASKAFILAMDKWQWNDAENEFTKALDLDPNSAKTHQWYATLLTIQRRFPEAEIHLNRAIELEPLSAPTNGDLCELYYFAGKYAEASVQCSKAHQLNPLFAYTSAMRNLYIQQQRYDEAAREYLEMDIRSGTPESVAIGKPWYKAYKKGGIRAWLTSEMEASATRPDVLLNDYNRSLAFAQLKDRDKVIECLNRCLAGHAFLLPFVNARPEFDFIRTDPEFKQIVASMGL